ncbi:hypothetical protein E4U43_001490 [Claviceps pusilla]|uniref:Uncharacterized protein n=1 Tax=Claviceps pusilla TaxID=123648 RepID=A0A9P7SWT1_9HYPO|nr:hypothetical protein E4U43_001490 [Claviceps pusilla]
MLIPLSHELGANIQTIGTLYSHEATGQDFGRSDSRSIHSAMTLVEQASRIGRLVGDRQRPQLEPRISLETGQRAEVSRDVSYFPTLGLAVKDFAGPLPSNDTPISSPVTALSKWVRAGWDTER